MDPPLPAALSVTCNAAVYSQNHVQQAPIDAQFADWSQTARGFPADNTYQRPDPFEVRAITLDRSLEGQIADAERYLMRVQEYWGDVANDLGPTAWANPENEWRQLGEQEVSYASDKFEQLKREKDQTTMPMPDTAPLDYELRAGITASNKRTRARRDKHKRARARARARAIQETQRAQQDEVTKARCSKDKKRSQLRAKSRAQLALTGPRVGIFQFATSQENFPSNINSSDSIKMIEEVQNKILTLKSELQTRNSDIEHRQDNVCKYGYDEMEGRLTPWSPSSNSACSYGSNYIFDTRIFKCKRDPGRSEMNGSHQAVLDVAESSSGSGEKSILSWEHDLP